MNGVLEAASYSMARQAALISTLYYDSTIAAAGFTADFEVKAVVLHHPFTHALQAPRAPLLVYPGTAGTAAGSR
jgi:hypothetical protein